MGETVLIEVWSRVYKDTNGMQELFVTSSQSVCPKCQWPNLAQADSHLACWPLFLELFTLFTHHEDGLPLVLQALV